MSTFFPMTNSLQGCYKAVDLPYSEKHICTAL